MDRFNRYTAIIIGDALYNVIQANIEILHQKISYHAIALRMETPCGRRCSTVLL